MSSQSQAIIARRRYSPYQEWLIATAYLLWSLSRDPDRAVKESAFDTHKQQEKYITYFTLFDIHGGSLPKFFSVVYLVDDELAVALSDRIFDQYYEMFSYYNDVYSTVVEFENYEFFSHFGTAEEAIAKLARLTFHTKAKNFISFLKHIYLTVCYDYNIDLTPGKDSGLDQIHQHNMGLLSLCEMFRPSRNMHWRFGINPMMPVVKKEVESKTTATKTDDNVCLHLGTQVWLQDAYAYICGDCNQITDDFNLAIGI